MESEENSEYFIWDLKLTQEKGAIWIKKDKSHNEATENP